MGLPDEDVERDVGENFAVLRASADRRAQERRDTEVPV